MPETMQCLSATITLAATCCLGLLLSSWLPFGFGARGDGPQCWSSSEVWRGQTLKVGVGGQLPNRGQQRDMRLRYCSTSGTRHWGEPLCSRKGCSSRSVALARSRGSRVSIRSRKSFRTGEIWSKQRFLMSIIISKIKLHHKQNKWKIVVANTPFILQYMSKCNNWKQVWSLSLQPHQLFRDCIQHRAGIW